MTLKKIIDSKEALYIVERYRKTTSLSNCYLMGADIERLVNDGLLWYGIEKTNAFLFEDKGTCFRIHYMINDINSEFYPIINKPLMLEILFRGKDGEPESVVRYWENQGFRKNIVRKNLAAKYSDLKLVSADVIPEVHVAETNDEGKFAQNLFNGTFDPYSGDYLSTEDVAELIRNKKILIAAHEGKACGALHFYNVGRCAWIGHVAVCSLARGRGLGSALVSEFIRLNHVDDKSRYSLWVQAQNELAITMYEGFGFKYTDKSSLSMIKI